MMAWFSVLIVTLTILSLSVNPAFSRVVDRSFPPEANEDSIQLIQLTNPFNFSSETSISLQFKFMIGKGVALAIIASDFPSKFGTNMSFEALDAHQILGIRFYANVFKISYYGDTEVSKTSNVLKDGVNLSSWIEYQATSKQLEVRLSKLDDPKPVEPLISVPVDLEKMLKGEEVVFGLACSSERHEKSTSWSLDINEVHKYWEGYFGNLQHHVVAPFPPMDDHQHSSVESYEEKSWFDSSWFMIALGCGLILSSAMVMFFVWSCVVDWQKVQAGGYKTDALEMKKNSEAAIK